VKLIRILLTCLGLAAALFAVLVAVALVPDLQTRVAQSLLSSQAGYKGSLGSLSAGFGEVDVEDLRLESGGNVLTLPLLKAKLPITTALWRRSARVRSLVARGWTLDLSLGRESQATGGQAAGEPAPAGVGGSQASPEAAAALEAAEAVGGLLGGWKLPFDASLDGVELEGDVILPAGPDGSPPHVHVVVKGGGLSSGKEAAFSVDVACGDPDAALSWHSFAAHCGVTARMDTPRSVDHVSLMADIPARTGSAQESVTVVAGVTAANASGEEAYSLDLSRGARPLASVAASVPRSATRLTGTWKVDVRDSDLAAFEFFQALPALSVAGGGRFDSDASFARVHALGNVSVTASRLGALAPPLDRLGAVRIDADFDMEHSEQSFRFSRLGLALAAERPVATVRLLQAFEWDAGDGALKVADPHGDWMDVSVLGLPLAWISGMTGGFSLSGGDVAGEFAVRTDGGAFTLRPKGPLTVPGVSLEGPGGPIAHGLDLSLAPSVEFGMGSWQVRLAPLAANGSGRRLASLEAKVSRASGASQPIVIGGKWSADLGALVAGGFAPALGLLGGRSASGDFSGSLGGASQVKATIAAVGRDPGRTITASVSADIDAYGRVDFLAPVKIATGAGASELSAEGTWEGETPSAGGVVNLNGGVVALDQLRMLAGPLAAAGLVLAPRRAGAGQAPAAAPPWGSWVGRVAFAFDGLKTGETEFSDVGGTLDVENGSIRLEGGRCGVQHRNLTKVEGTVTFDAASEDPYSLKATTAAASEVDAATLFPAKEAGQEPLVEGRFAVTGAISGSGKDLEDLEARAQARFHITSTTGILRLFQTSVAEAIPEASTPVADALDSVGSTVGAFFGHKDSVNSGRNPVSANAEAVLTFTNDVGEIGCDQITLDAVRKPGGAIRLEGLDITAKEEHITGSGTVSFVTGTPVFKEPLSLDLKFGALGRAAGLLSTAGLLSQKKDSLGYLELNQPVHLGGTLGSIDASQWHDLLAKAAQKPEPKKKE
jgi:hypothetical protein